MNYNVIYKSNNNSDIYYIANLKDHGGIKDHYFGTHYINKISINSLKKTREIYYFIKNIQGYNTENYLLKIIKNGKY